MGFVLLLADTFGYLGPVVKDVVVGFLHSGLVAEIFGSAGLSVAVVLGLLLLACLPGLAMLRRWPVWLTVALLLVSLTPALTRALVDDHAVRRRTFFGVYRVVDEVVERRDARHVLRLFFHGTTLHGLDWFQPDGGVESRTAYYMAGGPYAQVFQALNERPAPLRIGLAGLGAGSLLCHMRRGDDVRVYEIDAAVVSLSRSYFAGLQRCGAEAVVSVGDARLLLEREKALSLDVIVLDAFTSGSIPVHLLTAEAFEVYLRVLARDGVLVVHISNRYLNLEPLLELVAGRFGLAGAIRRYRVSPATADFPLEVSSDLVVLARERVVLRDLALPAGWSPLAVRQPSWLRQVWTDDHASLVPFLR